MTGNKRFTLCAGTINGLKSYYEYDRMPLTHLQVLDLLNKLCDKNKELLEEIEQLKQRIKELEIENTAQSDAIDGLQETLTHLDLGDFE